MIGCEWIIIKDERWVHGLYCTISFDFFTYLKFSTIKSKKKKANLNNVLLVHRKKDRKTNKKTKGGKGEREK